MSDDRATALLDADWAGEWRALEQVRGSSDNSEYWDKRAKSFPTVGEHSSYVDEFLRLADVGHGESVLDMGCGTGALAIPLASAGHKVVAADFSQGMLDRSVEEKGPKPCGFGPCW